MSVRMGMLVAKSIAPICAFSMSVSAAYALDTYDVSSASLTVANLVIDATEYLNVQAILGPVTVLSVGSASPQAETFSGPPPMKIADTFDPGTNILTIPDLQIGNDNYRNSRVRLGTVNVISVGGDVPYFEPPPSPSP